MTALPRIGDRYTVRQTIGYILVQYRPRDCRPFCRCGRCDGRTYTFPGIVANQIQWGDNSIDLEVRCDDGIVRHVEVVAPHGDRC